jgi:hypothetical protein
MLAAILISLFISHAKSNQQNNLFLPGLLNGTYSVKPSSCSSSFVDRIQFGLQENKLHFQNSYFVFDQHKIQEVGVGEYRVFLIKYHPSNDSIFVQQFNIDHGQVFWSTWIQDLTNGSMHLLDKNILLKMKGSQ